MLQADPANVRGERGSVIIRKCRVVLLGKFRSPIDVDIVVARQRATFRRGRDINQALFKQGFDHEARPPLRRVHYPDVSAGLNQSLNQLVFKSNFGTDHNIAHRAANLRQTGKQQLFPQAEPAPDGNRSPEAADYPDILAGALHGAHQCRRVVLKALTGGRQAGTRLVAHEQAAPQLRFQGGDSGAYRRLGNKEPFRCLAEIAGCHYCQERACQFRIHLAPAPAMGSTPAWRLYI